MLLFFAFQKKTYTISSLRSDHYIIKINKNLNYNDQ